MSMLLVHAAAFPSAFACRMCMLHVHGACPWCMFVVHVLAAYSFLMHIHAACCSGILSGNWQKCLQKLAKILAEVLAKVSGSAYKS